MKKLLCLCLAVLLCLCGCSSQPESTEPSVTETTADDGVFKVLMIGQSLAQDTVWQLCEVLRTEMPDREFLVVDLYKSIALNEHCMNIRHNIATYDYIVFQNGTFQKNRNYTINQALTAHQWDVIIFNDATYPTTRAEEFTDGDHQFMIDHIRKTAAPGYRLAYNATPANPTSALLYAPGRADPPEVVRERFAIEFGGSRNEYYKRICDNMEKYIESDPQYDLVLHGGTAIQYASETHGVPEADPERKYDLYRDYVHLSDFGRLLVAYQLYAQIFGLTELTEVNVNKIPKEMRATAREQAFGDLEITPAHKEAIIASVNFALKNPNKAPEQTARPAAILEPLG